MRRQASSKDLIEDNLERLSEDKEPHICKVFGCGKVLTLEERLCGDLCTACSAHPISNPQIYTPVTISHISSCFTQSGRQKSTNAKNTG